VQWILLIAIIVALVVFFPRFLKVAVLGVGLLVTAFVVYYMYDQNQQEERANSVVLEARYDEARCSLDTPILVTIRNNADETLVETNFGLAAYRSNFSKPIYRSAFAEFRTDRILEPGQNDESCWQVPRQVTPLSTEEATRDIRPSLEWRAIRVNPRFR